MGLGPINSIYQARFNKYLHNRRIDDTSGSKVWCFLGDGECDEPETLGSISLAAREQLDNLIWVVNCNLQRLDGPVRGNGKIIQELEAMFRGAGWNVIKVVWGAKWDELLMRDVDGVLLHKITAPSTASSSGTPSSQAPTSVNTSSGPTPVCASSSSTCPTRTCAGCLEAVTTTGSCTRRTRRPPNKKARPR
jgi:hypothetical protein